MQHNYIRADKSAHSILLNISILKNKTVLKYPQRCEYTTDYFEKGIQWYT